MSRTAVVIVTYNSSDDIEACVRSLEGAHDTSIIVIDNASADATPEILERLAAEGRIDTLVLSKTNDGFAKAVNRGLAIEPNADAFLLNPDARIDATNFERLRELAHSMPSVGVLAPLVDNGAGTATLGAGQQPRLWPVFTHFSGLARLFPNTRWLRGRHLFRSSHSESDHDVEWVSGCAMYITRAARAATGALSEQWFMYGEDIEYARRVSRAGFRIVMTPKVHASHAIGASVNQSTSTVSTMWAENTFAYYVSEFRPGPLRKLLWRLVFSGGLLSRAALIYARTARRSGASTDAQRAKARRFVAFSRAIW
ncbi:glycosyltransferase [Curtobacterium sp. MWU13-2055]|uniref:glycosyltransferase n=1 Tax=Curtobacterium sp. MWU13-2055 TaxID=2931928 RepID=UPI00200DAF18|nr:glycosyltransferase family 2 protein [Curtobacterium sp. MWU13-2055]